MDFKLLHNFLVVAQENQMTSAAKKLSVSQPRLTYQIKKLEKEYGVSLFERAAYGIKLTEAGIALQTYAKEILSLADTAKEHIIKTANGELGVIKIGVVSSSVGEIPNKRFHKLQHYYPDISFEIIERNTFGVLRDLNNGTVDLGIVRTPFNRNNIVSKPITEERMTLVTSDLQLLKKQSVSIDDLKDIPLIIYRRFEDLFNDSFSHAGISPYYAVKCDDSRTAILWAKIGMGNALVPESIAKLYAKNNFIFVDHTSWQTQLQLVWINGKVTPLLRRMIDLF